MERRSGFLLILVFLLCFPVRTPADVVELHLAPEAINEIRANRGVNVGQNPESLEFAKPFDSCNELNNRSSKTSGRSAALLIGGRCPFDVMVRNAQDAGFKVVVVIDYEGNGTSISPAPRSIEGFKIPVLVTESSNSQPVEGNSSKLERIAFWSIVGVVLSSPMVLLVIYVIYHLVTVGITRIPSKLSQRALDAIPTEFYALDLEMNCTSRVCAICRGDYQEGDRLRLLPCQHKYHAACVDKWLCGWKGICPVCKQDVREKKKVKRPLPTESTRLIDPHVNSQ